MDKLNSMITVTGQIRGESWEVYSGQNLTLQKLKKGDKKMKAQKIIYLSLIILLVSQFIGCIAAAAAYQAAALGHIAKGVVDGIEGAKVDAAVSPGVTKEQLNQVKRVAFVFEGDNPVEMAVSGELSDVMADTLIMEMLKLGFECIDNQKIKNTLEAEGEQINGKVNLENALKAGKNLGIQAIITGNIKTSSAFTASGVMSTKITSTSKIQSAALKIIGVENSDILMVVTINYKHGKNPDDASKTIAKVIKAKLENPFGEKKKT
jgi:hypothetical protein